jgi:hypothetical protein
VCVGAVWNLITCVRSPSCSSVTHGDHGSISDELLVPFPHKRGTDCGRWRAWTCLVFVASVTDCTAIVIFSWNYRKSYSNLYIVLNYHKLYLKLISRDNSVDIATGYGPDGRGSIFGGARNFPLLHRVQTGSGAHPASYVMGTKCYLPRRSSGQDVKLTTRLHLESRSCVFMACC